MNATVFYEMKWVYGTHRLIIGAKGILGMRNITVLALLIGILMTGCGKTWSYNAPVDDDWESKPIAYATPSTYDGAEPPQITLLLKCQPGKNWKEMTIEYGVRDTEKDRSKDYVGKEIEAKASVLAIEKYPITRVDGDTLYFEVPAKSQFAVGTLGEAGAMSIDYPAYLQGEGWVRRYVKLRTSGLNKASSKAGRECKRKYPAE